MDLPKPVKVINMCVQNIIFHIVVMLYVFAQIDGRDLYEGSVCKTKSGQRGVCKILQQCSLIDAGLKAKTVSTNDLVICSFSGDKEIICCPDNTTPGLSSNPDVYIFPKDEKSDAKSRTSLRKADKVCDQYKISYLKLPKYVDYHILDGEPTFLGEFPHMAAIGFPMVSGGQTTVAFSCGGSLISSQYVMTAAHCVDRPETPPNLIRLGTIYLDDSSADAQDFGVEKIILHPDYKTSLKYNDIALIRLDSTVPLSSRTIFPACLDTDRTDIEANSEVIATGWGYTSIKTRRQSDILLKITLSTVRLQDCNQKHRELPRDKRLPNGLLEAQMCAYDPNLKKDTCQGDSGGPLQIKLEANISKVIGVTSFGVVCGSAIPPVYTRVAFHLDWLEEIVWPNLV